MAGNEALITPGVLEWAIKRAGVSVESAHKKAAQWISGEAKPTFKQAMDIAKKLQIPFGYLWLKEPPKEREIIPDLRTIGNLANPELSLELKTLIEDMKYKQGWFKDYLRENELSYCSAVGNFSERDGADTVACDITKTMDLKDLIGARVKKELLLKALIKKCDILTILVMRDGIFHGNTRKKLALEEFRGFSIYDREAPLVFINANDSKAGQIFTLIHELAHLWIGKEGISDVASNSDNAIELFCNEVAARVLMPEALIRKKFEEIYADDWLSELSDIFSVSAFSILNRLKTLGMLNHKDYKEYYDIETEKFNSIPTAKRQKGAPPIEKTARAKNGDMFSFAVISSVVSGDESYTGGAKLLGYTKIDIIDKLGKELGIKCF